jgi:pimeloyl-ACP methyl ester carboxylesterase
VGKLVFIGQNLNPQGARPEMLAFLEGMTRENLPPMLEQMYASVSPDGPDHFGVVFDKLKPLWETDPGIAFGDLQNVTAPTLVLLGDDDVPSIEHAAELQRALPTAQLAVVPGASHGLPMEKPDIVNRLILDFLAAEQAAKMFGEAADSAA